MKKETGNKYRVEPQYIIDKLSVRGERAISGDNYGDEITHNAFDAHSSQQGIIINGYISYANDGEYLDWDVYVNRVILSTIPGTQLNSTSYWGKGTSKKTWWKDGCPNYTVHRDSTKYILRRWEYDSPIDPDNYLRKSPTIGLGGCNIVEYEITDEEYNELVPVDEFGFNPTFFVKLNRFTDSEIKYNSGHMINSINLAMMSFNHTMKSFVDVDGKRVESNQLYYNQVEDLGDSVYAPISDFRKLPKVRSRVEISGGIFDVYLYANLTESGVEFKKWESMYKSTDNGKRLAKIKGRGINPRHIWINKKGTTLSTYDAWTHIQGATKVRDLTYDTVMVFHLVDGDYEFPEIKTDLPTESVLLESGRIHLEEIEKNKKLQYSTNKKEDEKVDRCTKHLIEGDDLTYLHGLTESILHITEDSLNRHEIRNEDNFLVNETMPDGREYDWLLTDSNDEVKFHAEFQNDIEDWKHIDQTTYKVLSHVAPYNVLVVDKISKTSKKEKWKRILDENNIDSVVYLVTLLDFLNGRVNEFKRIK